MRLALLAILLHACPAPAVAGPCERSHTLRTGTPAPCAGLLVPEGEAVRLVHEARVDLPECRDRLANARQETQDAVEGLREAHRQEVDALEAMLASERTRPAVVVTETRTAWGWVVVAGVAGVVVGGVLVALGR